MELNGGSVVAMLGKDCVAIATDLRLGNQSVGIASNFDKVRLSRFHDFLVHGTGQKTYDLNFFGQVFPVNDKLYYGLPGLATDVYTLLVCFLFLEVPASYVSEEKADQSFKA